MKTTIEELITEKQIALEGRTFVKGCNCTVTRINELEYKFIVTKHDFDESRKFKTFNGVWNYMYSY